MKFVFLLLFVSSFVFADQNYTYIRGPALIQSTNTTATAGTTTTLTSASSTNQQFTGTTTQNVILPDATTLDIGRQFFITNRSTGTVTVKFNGGTTAQVMIGGTQASFIVENNGSAAGTWDAAYSLDNGITALTGDGTASGPGSAALTLATVNVDTGSIGSSTSIPTLTINGKGLITAAAGNAVIAPAGTLTGTTLASNVVTSSLTSLGTQAAALNMGSHQINAVSDPTSAQDAATKNYVDTQLAQLNPAAAVYAASTVSITGTYSNSVSGVCIGDTFTITATGAFSLDGTSPAAGARVLFKNQSSSYEDGVWVVTVAGSVGVSPVLTRASDFDTSADINSGSIVPVVNGTINAGSSWYQTATVVTCSSDSQTWTQFQKPSSAYLLVANNLSDVATKATAFNNISPMTTGGDLIYGGASGAGTRLANGSASQVLTSAGTTLAPAWGFITNSNLSGSAAITNANLATMATLTLKGNNTGGNATPSDLTVSQVNTMLGTLTNPMTTGGDIIYGGASGTPTRLANGSAGQVLTSSGGTSAPTWSTAPSTVTTLNGGSYPYAILSTDQTLLLTAGPGTIDLPQASTVPGRIIKFVFSGGTNFTDVYTISPYSGDTISGGISTSVYYLQTVNESVTLQSDGSSNWNLLSHFARTGWVSAGTNAVTATSAYTFTISSTSVTVGWTYTNNGHTFTATKTIASLTSITMYGTGAPAASGTLTCATGCSGNLTFSSVSTSLPAKANTTQADGVYWLRDGVTMFVRTEYAASSDTGAAAGTGDYLWAVPASQVIDTTNMTPYLTAANGNATNDVGGFYFYNNTPSASAGPVVVYNANYVRFNLGSNNNGQFVGSSGHSFAESGISFNSTYSVPIVGWEP